MKIITDISQLDIPQTVATIGFFDGLHQGHQFLVSQTKKQAQEMGLKTLIITFDQHPRRVLHADFQPKLLNTLQERLALIEKTAVDYCVVLTFTKELAQLSSYSFMKEILVEQLNVKKLLIGYDHHFGNDKQNGFEQYSAYGTKLGISVVQAPPFIIDQTTLSSSVIRRLIEKGNMVLATQFLGYHYFLSGRVIHGNKIGRKLHFPTANLLVDEQKQIPSIGIYAVKVEYVGVLYKAMLSIGTRPTIDPTEQKITIEVHLFDFNQEIYGEQIKVMFVAWVRNELKFDNLHQLEEQLKKDKDNIQEILKND